MDYFENNILNCQSLWRNITFINFNFNNSHSWEWWFSKISYLMMLKFIIFIFLISILCIILFIIGCFIYIDKNFLFILSSSVVQFLFVKHKYIKYKYYEFLYFSTVLAFLVKLSIFLVHLWLPKAQVETLVSFFINVAGIILKLEGHRLLRVIYFIQFTELKYNYIWVSISLVAGVLVSLICLRQIYLKPFIAYFSIAHIGITRFNYNPLYRYLWTLYFRNCSWIMFFRIFLFAKYFLWANRKTWFIS